MKYSILIPVAPDRDAPVIETINNLDYPNDRYEVIVEKGDNASHNRNKGIKKSKGTILAFVDDDAYVKPDWLRQADKFFEKYPEIDIVGGPQLTALDDGMFAKQTGFVFSSYFGAGKMSGRYKLGKENLNADELNITSCNMFVRGEVFSSIGDFRLHLFPNEETELVQRALSSGYRVGFSPNIVVYHKRRNTLKSYIKQCFNVGRGRARQDTLTSEKTSVWVQVPMIFMFYLILVPVVYNFTALVIVPGLVYLFVSLCNAITVSVRQSDVLALLAYPLMCFTLHIVYPFGYLCERLNFFNRN